MVAEEETKEKENYGGLKIERYFSPSDGRVYDQVKWERYNVKISDDSGREVFTQRGVEFPEKWSGLAMKVVASKYFYGEQGTPEREYSARELIDRVSNTIAEWGLLYKDFNKGVYFDSQEQANIFRDEIASLILNQKISFNSPVWFNVGLHKKVRGRENEIKRAFIINTKGEIVPLPQGSEYKFPQTSACFIQSVDDSMESIMDLAINEAMLFKYGSGTGTDLSTLRSSREKLSGGGKPSGPLAYLMHYDKLAGVVKSGGKTRRAAKMNSLRAEHPDIEEFIMAKKKEQEKLGVLMDYFASRGISPEQAYRMAEETVAYQNTNLSVRATDEFMDAALNDKDWQTIPVHSKELLDKMPNYKASKLLELIAESTWHCGDPGVQFHTTINKGHTCPNTAPINASNPCSEYMSINDSACNLASLNLVAFLDSKNRFDFESFGRAAKLVAIAQESLIDNSSYPTEKIARNSHNLRPLGQGYANLGSLLMRLGIPYDSEKGRATAAVITAYQTAKVYEASTELAEKLGPFKEFEKNKQPMLKVMKMHHAALDKIDESNLPKELKDMLPEAKKSWDNVIYRGEKYGFRNAQATVLAPTGTIAFMMDCDTTGIEPDLSLKKTKLLSDGGILEIVNQAIEPALEKLGYHGEEREKILSYAKEHGDLEGSDLKDEHLPVFDCAFKSPKGKRSIHYKGHIKMMAAVQPFLSGAISKTVNMPKDTTIEEIEQAYIDSWKMGLKAVAIYRDGSKRMQPLSATGKEKDLESKVKSAPRRKKLPITGPAIRHKFEIDGGHEGYIHPGMFQDGTLGEIFITMSKEGSTVGGLMDALATSISLNLQYGVPLKDLVRKFINMRFEPSGIVKEGHPKIPAVKSIVDYVFKYLAEQFPEQAIDKDEEEMKKEMTRVVKETEEEHKKNKSITALIEEPSGGFCLKCSSQMIRRGYCLEICSNPECNWVNPKGCGE